MANLTEKDLLRKKAEIEKTKNEIAELKGAEKQLSKTLKDEFGCDSLEDAKAMLKELETEISQITNEIELESIELEKLLEDGENT